MTRTKNDIDRDFEEETYYILIECLMSIKANERIALLHKSTTMVVFSLPVTCIDTISVVRVHHEDETLSVLVVMSP